MFTYTFLLLLVLILPLLITPTTRPPRLRLDYVCIARSIGTSTIKYYRLAAWQLFGPAVKMRLGAPKRPCLGNVCTDVCVALRCRDSQSEKSCSGIWSCDCKVHHARRRRISNFHTSYHRPATHVEAGNTSFSFPGPLPHGSRRPWLRKATWQAKPPFIGPLRGAAAPWTAVRPAAARQH